MSILLFGVSHRSAPVSVLEQLSIDESDRNKIVDRVLQSPLVTEAMVLSTCNRVEVYAVVDAFHGGLAVIGQVLSEYAGMTMGDLTKYAYVRYSEAAVEHLFAVASGLDSAVIGEQQVLGQVRRAYAAAESNRKILRGCAGVVVVRGMGGAPQLCQRRAHHRFALCPELVCFGVGRRGFARPHNVQIAYQRINFGEHALGVALEFGHPIDRVG